MDGALPPSGKPPGEVRLPLFVERAAQTPDDDAARPVVGPRLQCGR
jgi:hypothetical protein